MRLSVARSLMWGRLALGVAALSFLAMGVLGAGRTSDWLSDAQWFYTAGRCYLRGENPNDPAVFEPTYVAIHSQSTDTGVFGYPPQAAPLMMSVAWLEYASARYAWALLMGAGLVTLAWLAGRLWRESLPARRGAGVDSDDRDRSAQRLWLAALVLGSSFAWEAMWLGQVTGPVVALIVGAWILAARRRDGWAGVLLGLATFKPTLVALLLWWFVLERRWRLIGFAMAASLAMALYAMATLGPIESVTRWLSSLSMYQLGEFNRLGNHRVLGVMSLASAAGLPMPSPTVGLVAMVVLLTLLWWRLRGRLDMLDRLALITPLTPLFVYAHPHEALLALPMVVSLWRRWLDTPMLLLLLACWGVLSLPERVVGMLGGPMLLHWRTVLLVLLWALWLAGVWGPSENHAKQPVGASGQTPLTSPDPLR